MDISEDGHTLTLRPPKPSNVLKNVMHPGDSIHTFSFTKIFNEDVG